MNGRRVALTGMGAITPIGNSAAEAWRSMTEGKCGIGPITRFDASDMKAKVAGEVKDFNVRAYMDKMEAKRSDLYVQYAVAAAEEAVKESGIAGNVDPERLAVLFGSGTGGIGTYEAEVEKMLSRGPDRVSPYLIPMMISNMAAGTIAIRFGAKGPALPAVTACASGSNAIGEAIRLLRHGYADAVITGGAEASIVKTGVAGFVNMMALSQSEDPGAACLPFDKRRGGFVMSEGAAALVLEDWDSAVKRGATILAEAVGYGSTCDAHHMTSPCPDGDGGARAIRQALEEAGHVKGEKVYVNAHGTGTPMNDVCETRAIKSAFGDEASSVVISSTKSMTGHMMGAAGAIEAIACVMALRTGIIPPTINLIEPDPECDLDYTPLKAREWEADLAISNSFGFGGHNACLAFRRAK